MSDPNPHDPSSPPDSSLLAERRVEALADEYLERLLAGENPDRQAFLTAHPDLADLLEPRLALVELMHRVARAESETTNQPPPAAPAERALRVTCPHCGNGIQIVEPVAGEVTCNGCGSSFKVDPQATTTHHPAGMPGTIGKFTVLEQLGRGAFGTVYKARDPELQRLVAVKVPRAGSFGTVEEEERFLREARAAAQLSHPGIVPVLEIAHDGGVPYIVSEYVEGLTLADVLTGRRPAFRESAELVATVADALDYAHRRKIVHRDVKPSNLLIDHAGAPHVTDFGLARRGEGEITVTLDGQILGTPAYMAPEQAAGDQQRVDARSDVYSLGVVLYELLAGELPFRGNQRMLLHQVLNDEPKPPRSLNDRVPRDLETICLKAMAKVQGRRYGSALEMVDDLRRFLNGEAIRARPVGRVEKLARWARRNPTVAMLTTVVAMLLTAVAGVAVSFALYQLQAKKDLAEAKEAAEKNQREAEVRAASAAVDLDLKYCENWEIEYGILRLARTLGTLPAHVTELRQCVEMNLIAWAQELRPLVPRFQYDGAETTWELSPDGLSVLTGAADGTARLWDAFTGKVRATMRGHRGQIRSVAFSDDSRVAITIGDNQSVRLWDARNGQVRAITDDRKARIDKTILSSDCRRLLVVYTKDGNSESSKSFTILWNAQSGQLIREMPGIPFAWFDYPAAFSPDGSKILTASADRTARLWSADDGRELGVLKGHLGPLSGVAFGPDGILAATLANESSNPTNGPSIVRWWDTQRQIQVAPPCVSENYSCSFLQFLSPKVVATDVMGAVGAMGQDFFVNGMDRCISSDRRLQGKANAVDDVLLDGFGRIFDLSTGKQRPAPAGRKFRSLDLAR